MTPDIPDTEPQLFLDSLRKMVVIQKPKEFATAMSDVAASTIAVVTCLYDALYGKRLYLMHGDRDACSRYLAIPENSGPVDLGKGDGNTAIHKNGQWVYSWVDGSCDPSHPAGLGLVVHECHHATCRVMQEVGMELSLDSEEAYTYYVHWLVESWLSAMALSLKEAATLLGDRLKVVSVDSLDA